MVNKITGTKEAIQELDKAMDECMWRKKAYMADGVKFARDTTRNDTYLALVQSRDRWHVALAKLYDVMEKFKREQEMPAPPQEHEIAHPRYRHDCTDCKYLGQEEDYDLYYCPQGGGRIPTVIARWGNGGGEYNSGLETLEPILIEAERRAKEKGMLK